MEKETDMLDLNQPIEESSSSDPPIQLHNFMPMPSLTWHDNQDEYDGDSGFMYFLRENMLQFWNERMTEISDSSDLRSQLRLPVARIKRMMKSDQDVKMVSGDAPILVAKAIEFFVMELTLRAWLNAQKDCRGTLQVYDIARAIRHDELLALLLSDVVQIHDLEGESHLPKGTEHAYQLHLQNMNAEEANHCKGTELQLACPNNPNSMTPDFNMRIPEFNEQFPSTIPSMPSNNFPGSEAFHIRRPEFLEAFPSLISSLPSNYCPGSEAFYNRNPDIAQFPSVSSVPSNYHLGSE